MKLYLSSQKLGNRTDLLLKLVENNKNVLVIANAIDDKELEYRNDRVNKEINLLKSIGLYPKELDLRKYYYKNSKKELKKILDQNSLVWVRGGSTFLLSNAFKLSGFDKILKKYIKSNKIVYGGYSAGVIMANKDLCGVGIVDDIDETLNCKKNTKYKSLKLLSFYIIPHYDSKESWALNVKKHVEFLNKKKKTVVTLSDGEVYIFEKGKGKIEK